MRESDIGVPKGSIYYARQCGSTAVQVAEQKITKYDAIDSRTGRMIDRDLDSNTGLVFDMVEGTYRDSFELTWIPHVTVTPVYKTMPDRSKRIDLDVACTKAQSMPSSDENDKHIEALCHQGRSLYDLKPSAKSLYAPSKP